MALVWSDWHPDDFADPGQPGYRSPYTDWYLATDYGALANPPVLATQRGCGLPFALPDLPLSPHALPPGGNALAAPRPRENVLSGLSPAHLPGEDAVIVGIIDAGLALAHDRFRRAGGVGTRILSHWAQGGAWAGQMHLPFGRELTQTQIDALMGPTPQVDEDRFNRAAGLVDFADPNGERWIETAAPHGTHVADLAAGCDPGRADMARFRDRTHLLLVDLAPRRAIGPAGSFLEFFTIWAIRHIVHTADVLWQARFPKAARKGFPIVINLSYGFHAGPKDGTLPLQKFIRHLNLTRDPKAPPVRLVLPAGNDNLDQGTAVLPARAAGQSARQTWRVLPEDRTSSYAEVWSDPVQGGPQGAPPVPPAVALAPPGGPSGPGTPGSPGQVADLTDTSTGAAVARIYCRSTDSAVGIPSEDAKVIRSTGYVLCIAPTWSARGITAPSGAWQITLGQGTAARLFIQSDQALVPGAGSPLLSYFEDAADTPPADRYVTHNPDGSLRDTYRRDPVTGGVTLVDGTGQIRRRDTLNAIAGADGALTIAGYRARDGWPAGYSSSGRGTEQGDVDGTVLGKAEMEAACISDDGQWHSGRLAAGSRSGAAVVMQGTSFACAEATRIIAAALLDWLDAGATGPVPGDAADLRARAAAAEAALAAARPDQAIPAAQFPRLKLGAGRLPRQAHGRLPRIDGP